VSAQYHTSYAYSIVIRTTCRGNWVS